MVVAVLFCLATPKLTTDRALSAQRPGFVRLVWNYCKSKENMMENIPPRPTPRPTPTQPELKGSLGAHGR